MIITDENKVSYLNSLNAYLSSYALITPTSFELVKNLVKFQYLAKNEILIAEGEIARSIYFLGSGAIRAYSSNEDGHTYNKNLFLKNRMVGSMVSSLLQKPSTFTLQALDECILLGINFIKFKQLINDNEDLKNYYLAYLEKDWIIDKEQREVSLVMDNASVRYQKLVKANPTIEKEVSLLHIASHLGITPTQLSRIRKDLKISQNQHM